MNTLLIIRFIAFSGLLYFLYILVFKRFSFFAGNRWLLLCIPALSFLIPFVAPQFTNNLTPAIASLQLEEIILNGTAKALPETAGKNNPFSSIYYSGTAFMALLIGMGLIKAIFIKRKSTEREGNIFYSSSISSAYTFFRSIIIPLSLKDHKDIHTIIRHEQVHVRQLHGLDNLYYQIITALAWFNPFIHLLAKELRQTHECLADAEALEKTSREEYAHLLLSSAFGNELNFPLAAGTATPFFNSSLIKTRITMIYKTKTNRIFKWAYLALVPMIAAMTLYSCDKVEEAKSETNPNPLEQKDVLAFSQVDQPPLFPGCDPNASKDDQMACFQQGVMNHVAKNFEYPEKAKKLGMEGKVFARFNIDESGEVSNVEILRGLTAEEDNPKQQQAVEDANESITNLISKLPPAASALKDGKKVTISMTLPIVLKLD